MKIISIHDNNGNEVKVNLRKFINHINEFHKNGISIHEESGHYFTVDDKFREKLKKMITK
tara:strand:+ start:1532 stop:1711 length:180 start_codon:yes stop_codon:yes gene_type:complete